MLKYNFNNKYIPRAVFAFWFSPLTLSHFSLIYVYHLLVASGMYQTHLCSADVLLGHELGPAEIYREPPWKSGRVLTELHVFGEDSHPSSQRRAITTAKSRDFKACSAL